MEGGRITALMEVCGEHIEMYNISNMMCPYAYVLAGFMWFVRNGGKFVIKSFNFKKLAKSGTLN